jgi:hypothetical protein
MSTAKAYALTVTLQTGDRAPEGPGWYLVAHVDEGQQGNTFKRKISTAQAEELGRTFGTMVDPQEDFQPFEIITKGTGAAKEITKEELEEAERVATTVGILRKALGELNGS